jgi:hypothetical protein
VRAWLAWAAWLTARWRQGQVSAAIRTRAAGRGGFPAPKRRPLKIRTGPLSAALTTGCRPPPPASPRQVITGLPDTCSDAPPLMPWQVADPSTPTSLGRNRGGGGVSRKTTAPEGGSGHGGPHLRTVRFRATQPYPHVIRGLICLSPMNLGPRGKGQPQRPCPVEERPQRSHQP